MTGGGRGMHGAGRRTAALLACCGLAIAFALMWAASASAQGDPVKVLVFGPSDATNDAGVAAIEALGDDNDFGVDSTTSAADITTANLQNYRGLVFLNTSGNLLNSGQESAVQTFVEGGGGFLGIGSAAEGEPGAAFFDALIGARPSAASSPAPSEQTVAVGDRVHPATRDLPLLWNRTDVWYQWTARPTGKVHTVARYHAPGAPAGDGTDVGGTDQPISWCRDQKAGRSFYTGMGRTAGSYAEADFKKHLLGAIEWSAGLLRGGCKATIDANYRGERIVGGGDVSTGLATSGESHGLVAAPNGWVLYIGRGDCRTDAERGALLGGTPFERILDHSDPRVGMGCGNVHIWDPKQYTGAVNSGVTRAGTLAVYGDGGTGAERTDQANHKMEYGLLGITVAPDFTETGHIYLQYFPTFNPLSSPPGLGVDRRISKMSRPRISRFTIDLDTKQLDLSSEVRIFEYDAQIYSCCHVGGGMGFDSQGDLYVTTGDTNSSQGSNGYSGNNPVAKCPTGPADQASSAHCGAETFSYQDARRTAGNTNNYNGKMLRIKPIATIADGDQPTVGVGTTYTIPGDDAPNGPNLFKGDEGGGGKARPEIYAMGLRNPSRLSIDTKTDVPYSAWVGPDAGAPSATDGPSTYESAAQIAKAGNYGWPYCMGNGQAYRDRLADGSQRTTNAAGYVSGGPATGGTDGWYDCDELVNDSPNNTGLTTLPHQTGTGMDAGKMRHHNLWYSRGNPNNANGCPDFPRERGATGAPNYGANPTSLCPYAINQGMTIMNGPVYRYDETASDTSRRWPDYWDGRWFLHNNGGASIKHGLLLDPDTDQDGGQPIYADSLRTALSWEGSYMDSKFGSDGALYVQVYDGFFRANPPVGIYRYSYIGGANTPGANPAAELQPGRTVKFSSAGSGGVSYAWDFGDGETSTAANPTHVYDDTGTYDVKLTVTYADDETDSKTIPVEVIVTSDDVAPVTTHSLSPAPDGEGNFPSGTAVSVTLDATDTGGSGLGKTEYRVDGGAWQTYDSVPDAEWIFDGTQASFAKWKQAPGGSFALRPDRSMRTVGGLGMLWYAERPFGDFSLQFQFRDGRTDSGWSNGGAFVRFPNADAVAGLPAGSPDRPSCVSATENRPAWVAIYCGHEIQIHDDPGGGEPQKTGSVYNFQPRNIQQAHAVPKGTWSDYEIRVVGQSYTIIRNGEVLNEFENSPGKTSSRAGDPPTDARQFTEGYIGLQNHSNSDLVDYRDVKVTDLDDDARVGTGPFTVTGNGMHTVEYRSTDLSGNMETNKSATFRIGAPPLGTPPPGGGTLPPAAPSFSLAKLPKTTLGGLARRGLKVKVTCTGTMQGSAALNVTRATMRKLKLKSSTLARKSVRCAAAGSKTVTLKPSSKVAKALRKYRRTVKTTVEVRLKAIGQRTKVVRKSLTLRK